MLCFFNKTILQGDFNFQENIQEITFPPMRLSAKTEHSANRHVVYIAPPSLRRG